MMNSYEVAQILRELGILIELTDPHPEKGFAYKRAAQTIESIKDLNAYVQKKSLEDIPGIGPKIARIISSLILQKKLPYYEELKQRIPVSLFELLNIPGLNARKVRKLYEKLNIQTLNDLKNAIDLDQLKDLKIFRPSTILKLQKHIETIQAKGHSILYPKAMRLAEGIKNFLKHSALVEKIFITGELRRKCEVIYQIKFVAVSKCAEKCLKAFIQQPIGKQVQNLTTDNATVILKNGIPAMLKLVNEDQFSLALIEDTGNEKHVFALFEEAKRKEIVLSKISKNGDEAFLYSSIGLEFVPPELREGYQEIEKAKTHQLPQLIEESDLKGAFHCHTTDSDGRHTLEQMVNGARELGWEYIGIADHSKSSYQANGMNEERLFAQVEKIRDLNKRYRKFRIFSGIECDVLKDGQLDFPDEVLKRLDFVIISIHRFFSMEKKMMTERIIKAIEHPYTTIVGHLTGRLLRSRNPYELDIDKVIDACIANNKVMELNSTPDRLDMDWRYWIKAKEKGLLCSINPDAHSISDLLNCQYGIHMARKGWLEKKDVINTKTLKEMQHFLSRN